MKFARLVFMFAGLYGLLALVPCYLLEGAISQQMPPKITHPEFFYGFIGVALSWQFVFLVMSRDPKRYAALIPAAIFEKFGFAIPCAVLYLQNRLSPLMLTSAAMDALLGVLFVMCYQRLRR